MISRRAALVAGGSAAAVVAAGGTGYLVATHDKPEPLSPPSVNADGKLLWRNWSGIQTAYPSARLAPRDEGELASMLKTATAPVRPVGAGHSFTALAPTSGSLLSLDSLSGVIGWEGDEALVLAGTRLGALGPALAEKGRAMANLPDINKQSLAGALATATHGTGSKLQALHGDVTGLRLVTPDGRVIDCSADSNAEVFQAARVSLGALGVISQVRLKTIPNRRIRRRVWIEPFQDALAKAEARWAQHRNFEFYAVPFTGLAVGISHDETDDPAQARGADQDSAFLDALKGLRNLLGFSTPLRKAAARALLASAKPETAVDEGWKLLSTERPVRFNEMEFHLPADRQLKVLEEVVATLEKERPDVFFPIEVRRIASDDAWLSPFQGGARGSVAVHTHYKDDFAFLYELIEPIFRRHGGRPHWGKLHTLKDQQLAALYPRWEDFLKVRAELDPQGRMLNPYLKGLFGLV
ncbi:MULTISPECIES: D-arabinono-1,4-lactone oxidase [unclassified Caulobacter]|uniref:D-arabinono-1,4-lactone oxidase n=1 Tax=unclassified Caulobacter TaxID=2648921 RepID=UPI000D38539D|nr:MULTISPECIES: D-arabinono-1,4-lactone oxidase [unclassified Caulobacter]PTS81704.1 oxidoreductase [Caulobacter sp. HMWF009]PTT05499.1 oxidoreductase [Caulobacter sp. HMWF025]